MKKGMAKHHPLISVKFDQNLPAFAASSIETAVDTVMPTIGLLPAPIRPIISTCAGTEEDVVAVECPCGSDSL